MTCLYATRLRLERYQLNTIRLRPECCITKEVRFNSLFRELSCSVDSFLDNFPNSYYDWLEKAKELFKNCKCPTIRETTQDHDEFDELRVCLSYKCNLSCPMCYYNKMGYKKNDPYAIQMGLISKYIMNDAKERFNTISPTSSGEPFAEEWFFDWLLHLKESDKVKKLLIVTNMSLLNKDKAKQLAEHFKSINKKLRIVASIDSLNESIYNKIRPGSDLKNVLETAKVLYDYNDLLTIHAVVNDINKDELPKFGQMIYDAGFLPKSSFNINLSPENILIERYMGLQDNPPSVILPQLREAIKNIIKLGYNKPELSNVGNYDLDGVENIPDDQRMYLEHYADTGDDISSGATQQA